MRIETNETGEPKLLVRRTISGILVLSSTYQDKRDTVDNCKTTHGVSYMDRETTRSVCLEFYRKTTGTVKKSDFSSKLGGLL